VKSRASFLDGFYKVRICRRKDGVPIPALALDGSRYFDIRACTMHPGAINC